MTTEIHKKRTRHLPQLRGLAALLGAITGLLAALTALINAVK